MAQKISSVIQPDEQAEEGVGADLADLLQSMASEGAVNSSGVFTVDVRAALPKLEKFQLPRPHFGILKVVQSAVASGATYVDTNFGSTGITIEHDGEAPDADALRDLLSYLLSGDRAGERWLRDLAIGVNTSLARGASWVEVAARGQYGWSRQRWASREDAVQLESPADQGKANVRFVVRNTASQLASGLWKMGNKDIFGMMSGSRDVMEEDAQAVFDRCRFCPVKVRINGRELPASSISASVVRRWSVFTQVQHRKPNLLEISLLAKEPSPHLMSAPPVSQARHRMIVAGEFDGQGFHAQEPFYLAPPGELPARRCYAILGIRGNANVPGEMILIKDGVELTRLTPPAFPRGVSAIITTEGLRLDLSQFRLVATDEALDRIDWITAMIARASARALKLVPESGWEPGERERLALLST